MANQSFGMAFLKPAPENMEKFVEYVTKGKKPKFVKRGLKQLQQKHAKDANFDFYYSADKNQIVVVAKSDKAKQMYPETTAFGPIEEEDYPARYQLLCKKCDEDLYRVGDQSNLKQAFVGIKSIYNALKEILRVCYVTKTDVLPANLRFASDTVSEQEAKIAKQIAKEKLIDKVLK